MRVTQGTFSYLPDFTDEQIAEQIKYCVSKGWAMSPRRAAAKAAQRTSRRSIARAASRR